MLRQAQHPEQRRGIRISKSETNTKFKIFNIIYLILFVISCFVFRAYAITGEEVINRVDANMTFATARTEARMLIHVGDEVREKEMLSYERGRDTAYAEFLSPPRDKGVKYLKIKDNMWMYLPSVDKIIKISGAMLRQSMMGSDFSYEDALESSKLLEKYSAEMVGEEVLEQKACYVVELTAKVKEVTYYRRKVWVDKALYIPVREELFAPSGKKLKVMTVGDVKRFGGRYYPMYMTMSNILRANSQTEMFVTKIEFDIPIPDRTFTQGNLTK
jgi:outer membrane lipoprotein-sorting protein